MALTYDLDSADAATPDPLHELAVFRMVVDLVAVGRYSPLSRPSDSALRCIKAIAEDALDRLEGRS